RACCWPGWRHICRRRRRSRLRQLDDETGACLGRVLVTQAPAVLDHDRARQGQAEAGAVGLAEGGELGEEPAAELGGHSGPGVDARDLQAAGWPAYPDLQT